MMLTFINFVFWLIVGVFAIAIIASVAFTAYIIYCVIRGDD
ncbi:hypothetical protein [Lacticaseibacillus pantheris]|jgi:hypothetical protein